MNFARAWISRLIRLAKTGLGIAPVPMKDRLQAAREDLAKSLKPDPDYWRRHLAHISPERVAKCKGNMEALRD